MLIASAFRYSGQSGQVLARADPRLPASSEATSIATTAKIGPCDASSDTRIHSLPDGMRMKSSSESSARMPTTRTAVIGALVFLAVCTAAQI